MFPILFRIGPFTLHTYGLLVAAGILAGMAVIQRQAARDGLTGEPVRESLSRLALFLVLGGLVGARAFYAFTHRSEFESWMDIFKVWEGGLVFYGGVLGALAGFFFWNRSKPFAADWKTVLDWIAPALAFGHALGRLGCFSAGCCYGGPTDAPWGVVFSHPESLAPLGIPLHPTQIYEALFVTALGICLLQRRPKLPGAVFAEYLILYSAGRFALEFFRADDPRAWGLTPAQFTGAFVLIFSLAWRAKMALTKPPRL